jgi:ABC-2 type transport system permease protein
MKPVSLGRLLYEFFRRDAKIAMSYRAQFFFQVAGVFSVCVTFFFLSLMLRRVEGSIRTLDKYGGSYFGFVLIGAAFSTYLDSALRTFSAAIRQAQMTGTLEAMLTTRSRIGPMVAGSAVYALLFSNVRTLLYVLFGAFVFQLPIAFERWPEALAIVGLTITSTMALGIFAAGFIVLFKQGDPVTAAIAGLSWLLSGVLYPKEILPAWVQKAASFLPMTHTLESMRLALLTGAEVSSIKGSLTYLGLFSALGIPIAVVWFKWAVARARVEGSLARY